MPRTIALTPYDPAWPVAFARERDALQVLLGDHLIAIHHIGSTAVPGLVAKPIIDLLAEVDALLALAPHRQALASLGYLWKGENGIAGRRYFQKGGETRTHHLHVYQSGHAEIARHLRFRDYLRATPSAVAQYEAAKLAALISSRGEPEAYQRDKSEVIASIERAIDASSH